MKKDNWRFEALARAKIIRQEEAQRDIKHIEDFKPAEEIERLQNINADLLEACKDAYKLIALERPVSCGYVLTKLSDAIAKAKGR